MPTGRISIATWNVWFGTLRPGDPGYSMDTAQNPMLLAEKGAERSVRFDRMLLRAAPGGWRPSRINLLGTAPFDPRRPHLRPSDHFGLLARFER